MSIANYRTEAAAHRAMRRFLRLYPVHADCQVDVVHSPTWLYPFRFLIRGAMGAARIGRNATTSRKNVTAEGRREHNP